MADSISKADGSAFELTKGKIERGTKESGAFDLFYTGERILVGDKPTPLPTGVFTRFTKDLRCIIKERSGLGIKGLEVKAGVIDADFQKEWKVIVRFPVCFIYEWNEAGTAQVARVDPNWAPFEVKPGDKIAQFLICKIPEVTLIAMPTAEIVLSDAIRVGGFGSTDAKPC